MKKRAEELSVVPDFIREKFRKYLRGKKPSVQNKPPQGGDNIPEKDREKLQEMINKDEGSEQRLAKGGMVKGYAGGGMVKGYAKGGMVKVRGAKMGRSKPCKIY